jgi:hypothetical protein
VGATAPASLWVLRGDLGEPRDPALQWVTGQVRDAGGLAGFESSRYPVRAFEWALLALGLGFIVPLMWPRRILTAVAALALLAAAATYPLQGWRTSHERRGVVDRVVRLEASDLELEPGQVVSVLRREGARARVRAGRDVSGWLPAPALITLGDPP